MSEKRSIDEFEGEYPIVDDEYRGLRPLPDEGWFPGWNCPHCGAAGSCGWGEELRGRFVEHRVCTRCGLAFERSRRFP